MTTRNIIRLEGKTFSVTGSDVWMTAGEIAEIFNTTATAVTRQTGKRRTPSVLA